MIVFYTMVHMLLLLGKIPIKIGGINTLLNFTCRFHFSNFVYTAHKKRLSCVQGIKSHFVFRKLSKKHNSKFISPFPQKHSLEMPTMSMSSVNIYNVLLFFSIPKRDFLQFNATIIRKQSHVRQIFGL